MDQVLYKNAATSGRFYSEDMLIDGEHIIVIGSGDDVSTSSNKYFWFIKTDLSGEAVITRKIDVTSAFYDGVFAGIKKHDQGILFMVVYTKMENIRMFVYTTWILMVMLFGLNLIHLD
ncbi:MAG: hypothetical protein IPO24_20625 [Bacteroidetes bacterium]|nr:hypothetical protein [Bacteroidota bacterium]